MTDLIDRPAVVLRIGKKWHPEMDLDEVYDTVRGWWLIGPKREQCEYAIAVARGTVRGVYQIHSWRPRQEGDRDWQDDLPGKPRWGFDGAPAPDLLHLVGSDVSHLFTKGAANPVTYLNC
ncbi:hypothetical protein [Friedmanniella luteola]|uniref:hypothetical protein n=1 Tax=Friedmanniella luteola TaxID=546871 RepID=UPI000B86924B|nr:hypothetical protein [Friedmanniella luteola]